MSDPASRASELAAAQVEQIVTAAQEAADRIRSEAEAVRHRAQLQGEREAEAMRKEAHEDAEAHLHEGRKQAILLTQDARRDAEAIVSDAREEATRIREQTKRAVEGRVVAAENAAAEVLAEARTLSAGLRQLGRSLEDQAERILREVETAHKRMQADLRVGGEDSEQTRETSPGDDGTPIRARRNPLRELEVPTWVAPE